MGQVPAGAILLVENTEAAEKVAVEDPDSLAYITQTTLSVDDTTEIIAVLMRRFPKIHGPKKEDICYATTNRCEAARGRSRSEEHTSELQSLMRTSYAVFCLTKKKERYVPI